MKTLSKSTWIMFLYDLLTLCISTIFWCYYFSLKLNILILAVFLVLVAGLTSLYLKENYKIREFNITIGNTYRLFEGVIFAHIPMYIILSFFVLPNLLLKLSCLNILTVFVFLCLYRICFHYYLFNFKKVKNILILGTDERARVIADKIKNKFALRMNVVGLVESNIASEYLKEKGMLLCSEIEKNSIDIVIISQPTLLSVFVPKNVNIYKMPEFYEMLTGKYYIDEQTISEFGYQFVINQSLVYDLCKRIFDIIVALVILIITLPITGYIALRVWLTDKNSPFYIQSRIGQNGKIFSCYKLRTMYINDYEPQDYNNVKYAQSTGTDDRIIPFCRFVRKARFDEIPQMLNILNGEMSIVGPRTEPVGEAKIFEQFIPYYNMRQVVKAGWTGWSHINMNPVFNVDEEKERVAYDLYYIKHRNILWDFAILVKAVFLACGGRHK